MKWESDLNIANNEQLWADLRQNSLVTIISARYRLINYILLQLYLTREKLRLFKCDLSDRSY